LKRLIVRRDRSIFQSTVDEDPRNTIGVQHERSVPRESGNTFSIAEIAFVIGRLFQIEIGSIKSGPGLFCFIPPDKFLLFAPGCAVGGGGGAIVDNATVVGPSESPTMAEIVFGFA